MRTPLGERLAARIKQDGPLSVAAYMQACLHDPEHGYYRTQAAIGRAGDFVTAPEISQVFGELIGLWCAVVWRQMGEPRHVRLVELGPGRGTLMRDALRAAGAVPAFRAALSIDLVETNATLMAEQRAALAGEDVPIRWGEQLDVDGAPVIVVANEFLDTLPVSQWTHRAGAWRERRVGIGSGGKLGFVEAEAATALQMPCNLAESAHDGDIYETRAAAFDAFATDLKSLGSPLAALFIDYGHAASGFGDTLQAVRGHRYAAPLEAPGETDLTAQVDFADFCARASAAGLACDGPLPQGEFLGRLGAAERAARLMAANPAKAASIEAGVARLLSPNGMGSRFHAVACRTSGLPPLPGFAPVDMEDNAP